MAGLLHDCATANKLRPAWTRASCFSELRSSSGRCFFSKKTTSARRASESCSLITQRAFIGSGVGNVIV